MSPGSPSPRSPAPLAASQRFLTEPASRAQDRPRRGAVAGAGFGRRRAVIDFADEGQYRLLKAGYASHPQTIARSPMKTGGEFETPVGIGLKRHDRGDGGDIKRPVDVRIEIAVSAVFATDLRRH
jgi:hypothetical protein